MLQIDSGYISRLHTAITSHCTSQQGCQADNEDSHRGAQCHRLGGATPFVSRFPTLEPPADCWLHPQPIVAQLLPAFLPGEGLWSERAG